MDPERRLDEPWNLCPVGGFCGNPIIHWAQQTPDERKAEWMSMPESWREEQERERIAYARSGDS